MNRLAPFAIATGLALIAAQPACAAGADSSLLGTPQSEASLASEAAGAGLGLTSPQAAATQLASTLAAWTQGVGADKAGAGLLEPAFASKVTAGIVNLGQGSNTIVSVRVNGLSFVVTANGSNLLTMVRP
ncbi:MAG: hypothetical protein ACREEW_12165 [Caulobacteraceae bacterium]